MSGFVTAILPTLKITSSDTARPVVQKLRSQLASVTTLPVPHQIFCRQSKRWKRLPPKTSPTIELSVALDKPAYAELGLIPPELTKRRGAGFARARRGTADTGAQLTVMHESELMALGVKKHSIFPVAMAVNTVTKTFIDLIGGIFLKLSSFNPTTGKTTSTRQLCYVSTSVNGIYLSEDACQALQCIPEDFPCVGSYPENAAVIGACSNTGVKLDQAEECRCPTRELPPKTPPQLPCDPTEENLPALKEYILKRYASSAFNCCEHQPLPVMDTSPPLRLFVDKSASPIAALSPSKIPLHWVDAVKQGLDRDINLGVLEQVPINDPQQWCSHMVVTPKTDGTPRRTIDFSPINKHAPRQLHHTRSPYIIATSVPANTVKTVLDNWHGYHSVPIHPEDRPLTTFITPYGRYRYKTAPQGFISAGDGYTQRMDIITDGTENYDHCVDDSILWDGDIQTNFFRVCDFIEKCANAGCTFNPKKFQFAQSEVEFIGFKITKTGLQPTDAFLECIKSFPEPKNLTDVRAWFGTVNQVSYSFAVADQMEPFRRLLSSKLPFAWSAELSSAFQKSKMEILRQCALGVRKFQLNKPTALATDWSKTSVGCWLTQKFCQCKSSIPGCCKTGWQTVHVASKFNSPAVSNYHPIEGEAYAAAWALEKCRMFVLGNPHLTLAVDHKPLLAVLGPNQDLQDVINPRLMNFKLKSMAYRFQPVHVPGKKHVVPDTMSRRSDSPAYDYPRLPREPPTTNNVLPEYQATFGPPDWVASPSVDAFYPDPEELYTSKIVALVAGINNQEDDNVLTWEMLAQECSKCPDYKELHAYVVNNEKQTLPDKLKLYARVIKELTTLGPVVMLNNRVVIPSSLRHSVLRHLHSAHGGTQSMIARAMEDVYWPNYISDIEKVRAACHECIVNAPSNPKSFSNPTPDLPQFPFQVICSDFFSWRGKNYLIIVDKYSNWLSVLKLARDDSKHVIMALRQYFTTFGVAEKLCTDGAAVFTSYEMSQFCKVWGVQQRISSAYHAVSNKRAEVGVKSAKRMIRNNTGPNGSLETNEFSKALLAHRNCPDPSTKVSPAQIVFGRSIRDHIPRASYTPQFQWQQLAQKREDCFLRRHFRNSERLDSGAKKLVDLAEGDTVYVQDQTGPSPKKWNKSGVVVQCLPYDSFLIKLDGSNNVTKRNRQFLRRYTPFLTEEKSTKMSQQQPVPPGSQTPQPSLTPTQLAAYHMMDSPISTIIAAASLSATQDSQLASSAESSLEGASRTRSAE